MPKLNKLLVTSIIADIRECVCVANEIYSWVGGIEHLSWKFPTKIARDINAMEIVKEHEGTAGEFYILLLELAYDRKNTDQSEDYDQSEARATASKLRLKQMIADRFQQRLHDIRMSLRTLRFLTIQFILRLIVEFMDKYPFVDDFFKEVAYINRPNHISMASLIRLVWDRLKTLPESISRQMVKNSKNGEQECFTPKVSRSCQAGGSMNYCESCGIAGEAVLQAINTIEHVFVTNKLISVAAVQRNECKDNIYERTQWSVMKKLTYAIGEDVETALKKMADNDSKIVAIERDHEKSIRELQTNLTTQEKRMDILLAKNHELEDALENVKEEVESTKRSNITVKSENETLKKTLEDSRRQISNLTGGNNILQSQVATLSQSKLELEKTVIRLRKEVIDTRDACLETERRSQVLLDESRKENDSLKEKHREEMERLRQEIASLRSKSSIETNDGRTDNDNSKGVRREAILMPKDDPVADMTRQLISNREKIEVLSRQNDRLSKTLHRLREYRLTGQITTNGCNK